MKAQNSKAVNILDRTEIRATGVVLYEIASESKEGYIYYITCHNGKVDPETHQDCEGYAYRHTCRHCEYIEEAEATYRYDVVSAAEDIIEAVQQAEQEALAQWNAEMEQARTGGDESDPLVNTVRYGKLVAVRWSQLSRAEREAAEINYRMSLM